MGTNEHQVVSRRKAAIALAVALSCFLIYVLACVWSAPSWSPDSSGFAVLVTEGGVKEDPGKSGIFLYDLKTREHRPLDEAEKGGALSSPAWSPDGKWIAYYRLKADLPEQAAATTPANVASESNQTVTTGEKGSLAANASKLFSEQNRMLPPFMFDELKTNVDEKQSRIYVELVIASPDGKESKTLKTLEQPGSRDDLASIMLMRPEWSKDSQRLFYSRGTPDEYYVSSLDLTSGQMAALCLSALGVPALSPDGQWLASLMKSDAEKELLLVITRTDGSVQKYFRLNLDIGKDSDSFPVLRPSWSPDSRLVLVAPATEFGIVDTVTGQVQRFRDPDTNDIAYGVFAGEGQKLYYVAYWNQERSDAPREPVQLRSYDLKSRKTRAVFTISDRDIPNLKGCITLSLSPDGRKGTLWCVSDEDDKSALLLWDGKTRRVLGTQSWLTTPLYGDKDVIFDERLVGKWKADDGEITVARIKRDQAYALTLRPGKEEQRQATAQLFQRGDMLFLGVFLYEPSRLKGPAGPLYQPDMFLKVDQIEPKLLLREMDYDQVRDLLEKGSPGTEKAGDITYTFEGVRASSAGSKTGSGRR
jgi:Tol biopolymer transport system component